MSSKGKNAVWLVMLMAMLSFSVARAELCSSGFDATNPDNAYLVSEDGTVIDTSRGLMWKQCVEGRTGENCASGSETTFANWGAALDHAYSHVFAGYSDWRLPTVKELRSLVEPCRSNPAINVDIFPATPAAVIMTSSPTAAAAGAGFWMVHFDAGNAQTRSRTNDGVVRLVRDRYLAGRYELSSELPGTVRDVVTNISWQRCYVGQSWDAGSNSCSGSVLMAEADDIAAYSPAPGWRLPTLEELQSLVLCSSGVRGSDGDPLDALGQCLGDFESPTLFTQVFPGGALTVWSASDRPLVESLPQRYVIDFNNGQISYQSLSGTTAHAIRLVKMP